MSDHAAVSAYGRLPGDPRAIETRTGDTVGAFGRVKINRYTNRDGEAREELSITTDGLVSARTVRPGGGRKKKATAAPHTPDPLLWVEIDRPEQPEPVPAGPVKITDADIPF